MEPSFVSFNHRHIVMICRGESEFMKNYSTSIGLKTIQAFSENVLMALLQSFIVLTSWKSLGKLTLNIFVFGRVIMFIFLFITGIIPPKHYFIIFEQKSTRSNYFELCYL